jgi:phage terminase large subunit GpA-like protein
MPIWAMAIDTGFRPQNVYDFCRNRPLAAHGPVGSTVPSNRTVIPTKGGDSNFRLVEGVSSTDAAQKRHGLKIVTIGTHKAKGETYDALRLEPDADGYPPGYCHHPEYEQEYFKGLTAETRVVRQNGDVIWRKDGRNEPLDCHVMNMLAAELCAGRFTEATWQELERRRQDVGKGPTELPAVGRSAVPAAIERQWAEADVQVGPQVPTQKAQQPARPIRGRFI